MNLNDIISRVNSRLQHNPQMQAYTDAVANIVAEANQAIESAQKWLWLQKEVDFPVYATVSGTASITATFTNGSYEVELFGVEPQAYWAGQILGTPNTTYPEVRLRGTPISTGSTSGTVYLESAWAGATATQTSTWYLRFYRYLLPKDCLEPLLWMDRYRNRGWQPFIDRMTEETQYFLSRDDASDPEAWIEADHEQVGAPDAAPTVTLDAAAAGTLATSTEYEYGYTKIAYGIESPMSPTARTTTTATRRTINLSAIEDTRDGALTTKIRKNVYRRDVTNNGRWLLLTTLEDLTTTYADDNSPAPSTAESSAYYPSGARQWIRPWPRASTSYVSSTQAIKLRYKVSPRPLVANSDVPLLPEPYHALLIHRAVEQVAMMSGQTSVMQFAKRQGDELYGQMLNDKRCIERSNRIRVRGTGIGVDRWPYNQRIRVTSEG